MTTINKTQASFSGGIVSTELLGRIDFEKLNSSVRQCENFIVRPLGGVSYTAGTEYICEAKENSRLIPFLENIDKAYCLEFSDNLVRVINKEGVLNEIESPYSNEEIKEIKYAQYKNELYLTQENHKPTILIHNDDDSWSFSELKFNSKLNRDDYVNSITISSGTHDSNPTVNYDKWQYAVSVVDKDENESLALLSNVITNDISLSSQPINISATFNATNCNEDNIQYAYFYRVRGGDFYFVQKLPITDTVSFKDSGLALDETHCIKEEFTDFDNENPRCVSFFNQRLILAGTKTYPNDLWGSRVGFFDDFTKTINNRADESFNLTLSSGTLDSIEHLVPLDALIVFSSGKIWRVTGTSVQSMQADIESYSSISDLVPSTTKKSILYVDASLNTISNFVYSYELNGYVGQNLDILARELFDGHEFIAQSFRNNPFPVMFVVRKDGIMLALTYLREENIYAWSKMSTQGKYKDICCLNTKKNDTIYTIVERKNGAFIEVFLDQITTDQDIEDSCYLHSAKIIEDNSSDTVTGLDWLKGMTVDVVADRNIFKNVIVSEEGSLTIDGLSRHSRIVIGLSYRGLLQTNPFEIMSQTGSSSLGLDRKINNATLMYSKTRGLKYGTSIDNLSEIKPYVQENFGEEIPLETGRFNVPVSSSWNMETSFFVVQDYPCPCFLQNITLEIKYGNKN